MDGIEAKRERLADLTFAMRIIAKQHAEDMVLLLGRIEESHGNKSLLQTAAERTAQPVQQTLRYTKYVEAATARRAK